MKNIIRYGVVGTIFFTLNVSAYNEEQLNQLLTTKVCENCDLSDAPLGGAQLNGADVINSSFDNADMGRADFSNSDANGAYFAGYKNSDNMPFMNFSNSSVQSANFKDCQLSFSDLSGTNFSFSFFINSQLSFANMQNADLSRTFLYNNDFFEVDLTNADLSAAVIINNSLSHAIGLTQEQLDTACGGGNTLPTGLVLQSCDEPTPARLKKE